MTTTAFAPQAQANHGVALVWPGRGTGTPERFPSRPKRSYRPRGTRQVAPAGEAVWKARTTAVAERKRARKVAAFAALVVPLVATVAVTAILFTGPQISPLSVAGASLPAVQTAAPIPLAPTPRAGNLPPAPLPEARPQAAHSAALLRNESLPPAPFEHTTLPAAPSLMAQLPISTASAETTGDVSLSVVASAGPLASTPPALLPPARDSAFACTACTTVFPQFGQVSFAIHATDPDSPRIRGLLADLSGYQTTVAPPSVPLSRNAVRYYRPQDAAPAGQLAAIYDAALIDLTWFAPDAEIPRIEVMLAPAAEPSP